MTYTLQSVAGRRRRRHCRENNSTSSEVVGPHRSATAARTPQLRQINLSAPLALYLTCPVPPRALDVANDSTASAAIVRPTAMCRGAYERRATD